MGAGKEHKKKNAVEKNVEEELCTTILVNHCYAHYRSLDISMGRVALLMAGPNEGLK